MCKVDQAETAFSSLVSFNSATTYFNQIVFLRARSITIVYYSTTVITIE